MWRLLCRLVVLCVGCGGHCAGWSFYVLDVEATVLVGRFMCWVWMRMWHFDDLCTRRRLGIRMHGNAVDGMLSVCLRSLKLTKVLYVKWFNVEFYRCLMSWMIICC